MNKKILMGSAAACAGMAVSLVMMSGESDQAPDEVVVADQVVEKNLHVSTLFGVGEVKVAGPCYEGTRGNDVLPSSGSPASDCYNLMSEGRDYLDVRGFDDDVYLRVSEGSDSIFLGDGDDVIEVRGSFEIVVDAGGGENVLSLPGLDVPDVSLRVEGEDILLEGKRGSIRMMRQYPRSGEAAPIQKLIFENRFLSASEIYTKAVDGQASDGDDILTGTPGDDVIYPGKGNDQISALEGDDVIFYEGGNDTIMGSFEGVGDDRLSFPFSFESVTVTTVGDRDMVITTPLGVVTLQFQVFFPVGDERSNIETFVFTDGVYTDADLRGSIGRGMTKSPKSRGSNE